MDLATDTKEITRFLKGFSMLIDEGKVDVLSHRPANRELLEELLMSDEDVLIEIKELNHTHFIKREFDRNHFLEMVWIFKKEIDEAVVYIKIQSREDEGTVISFHRDN